MQQRNFIHRVSNIPLVNTALRAYESSKNSSTMMKYGAEMVESFATPIYDKFGKQALSSVDEWGCKQLDRVSLHLTIQHINLIYFSSWKNAILTM